MNMLLLSIPLYVKFVNERFKYLQKKEPNIHVQLLQYILTKLRLLADISQDTAVYIKDMSVYSV